MAPGDTVSKAVTVSNDGSLALRYAITSTTDEDILAAQLDLWIWDEAQEDDTGGILGFGADNATCDATPDDGSVGAFAYTQGVLGSTTPGTNVVGGTRPRATTPVTAPWPPRTARVLCFYVELPLSTDSSFENATTTASFDFVAEQTATTPDWMG